MIALLTLSKPYQVWLKMRQSVLRGTASGISRIMLLRVACRALRIRKLEIIRTTPIYLLAFRRKMAATVPPIRMPGK